MIGENEIYKEGLLLVLLANNFASSWTAMAFLTFNTITFSFVEAMEIQLHLEQMIMFQPLTAFMGNVNGIFD